MKKIWIETTQKWHKGDETIECVSMTEKGTIDIGHAKSFSQMITAGWTPGIVKTKRKVQIRPDYRLTGISL